MRVGEEITREAKKARKVGGLAGSSSDGSGSESDASDDDESDCGSSRNVSSGDDDDFNPFRDESSEDDEDGEPSACPVGAEGQLFLCALRYFLSVKYELLHRF